MYLMEKSEIFIFKYDGINGISSSCRVYILHAGKAKYIGLEDIGLGTDVKKGADLIISSILKQKKFEYTDCLFFEWYYYNLENPVEEIIFEEYNNDKVINPTFKHFCIQKDNPFKK